MLEVSPACGQLSQGIDWPGIAHPVKERLIAEFSRPHVLEASFDTREEAAALLHGMDPSISDSTLSSLADALFGWKEGVSTKIKTSRRAAVGHLLEVPAEKPLSSVALSHSYEAVARQNPLALLSALRKRKGLERQLDKESRATLEAQQRHDYALKLAGFIREAKLPVCEIIARLSDPDEAWPRLFGTRRSKTLRNRYRAWVRFREWLEISRERLYPSSVADVVDYAVERFHDQCGKTVLGSFQASLSVLEIVGRVPESQMISRDPTWITQLRSMTADLVSTAPAEAHASMFTIAILLALELFICRQGYPLYLRALAFVQLIMVWCSMRADDVQGLLPETMRLDDSGFSMDLDRSKTTGPDRRTKRVKIFVDRSISLTGRDWLKEGFSIWASFTFPRDYLVLKANNDFTEPVERGGDAATVALYMRKVLTNLDTPKKEEGKWRSNEMRPLLPELTSCHFNGHSARNFLPSVGAAIGIAKDKLDYLGRWKIGGEGAASYIRTARQVIHGLQTQVAQALVTGQPMYRENDAMHDLTTFAIAHGADPGVLQRRHAVLNVGGKAGLGAAWPTFTIPVEEAQTFTVTAEHEQPAAGGKFFIVTSKSSGVRRLHLSGCYVKPHNCHVVQFVSEARLEDVDAICKDCKARMRAEAGEEPAEPSSSDSHSSST